MRSLLTISILLFSFSIALSQTEGSDVSKVPEPPKAGFISNVVFQFDNRNERYYETRGRMNGLKLGLEFKKRLRTGFGFYANNDHFIISEPKVADRTRTARFNYATFFAEIVFYRSFRWELSTAGAIGSGQIEVNNYATNEMIPKPIGVELFEDAKVRDIGLNAQFKIFPWLGIGTGVGYRHVNGISDVGLLEAYRDPYLDFKLKFFLGYAVKSIFNPDDIEAEKEYYDWRRKKRHEAFKSWLNHD